MHGHSSNRRKDLNVTASQCRTLENGGSITLKDGTPEFKKRVKTTVVKQKDFDNDGVELSDNYRNVCDSNGWVNRKTFEDHVSTKDGKVMSKNGLQLP